ncbi:hypothetical protein JHK85_004714 [Glycine max]|nr:hypothetical protein JHK85_004714 [Glycine max]KAG5080472.1 hypothetical protein JHK86_004537 [Glycine max]
MKGEIVVKQSRDFQPFAVVIVVEQILQNYFLPTITCYDGTRNLVHHSNWNKKKDVRNDGLWMNSGGIERPRVVTKVIETIPLNTNTGEILRDNKGDQGDSSRKGDKNDQGTRPPPGGICSGMSQTTH